MTNPFDRFRRWWSGEPEPLLPDVEVQPYGQPATFPNQHFNGYQNEYRNHRRNDYYQNGQIGGQSGEYRYDYGNHQRGNYLNEPPNDFRNGHRNDLRNNLRNEYHNNRHDGRYDEYRNEHRNEHRNTYRNNPGNNPRNNQLNDFDNNHRNARRADFRDRNGDFNDNHNNHRDRNRNEYPSYNRDNYRQPSYESEESYSSNDDSSDDDSCDDDSCDDDFATCPDTNSPPSDAATVRPSPRPESLRSFQRLRPGPVPIAGSSRDSSVLSTAASRVFDSGPESPRCATPATSIDGNDDDLRGPIYGVVSDDDTDSDTTYVPRPFDDTMRSEYGSNPSQPSDPSGSSSSSGFHLQPGYQYARVPSTLSVNTTDDGSVETVVQRDSIHDNNNGPRVEPPIVIEVSAPERSDRRPACHTPRTHRGREEVPRKKRTHRRKRSPTKKQEKRPEHQKKEVSRVPIPYFAGDGFTGVALKKAARKGKPEVVRSILANAPDNYLQSTEFSKDAILECVKNPSKGTYLCLELLVKYVDKAKFNNMREDRKTLPFLLLSETSRNNFSKYQRRSLRLLLKVVTCVDEKNGPESQTALHLAVGKRLPRAVAILLARGASPDIPDANGITAKDLVDDKVKALGRKSLQEVNDWVTIQRVFDKGVGHAD